MDEGHLYEEFCYFYESNNQNLKYLADKRLVEMDLVLRWGAWLGFAQVSIHLLRELSKSYTHTVARFAFDAVLAFDLRIVSAISNQLIDFPSEALIQMHTWDWILGRPMVQVVCHLSAGTG